MKDSEREERQHHAKELLNNPLFKETFDKLERAAIDRAIYALPTDRDLQQAELAYLKALRSFRSDCEAIIRNTATGKAAPA